MSMYNDHMKINNIYIIIDINISQCFACNHEIRLEGVNS
jgi:hypothetical protein